MSEQTGTGPKTLVGMTFEMYLAEIERLRAELAFYREQSRAEIDRLLEEFNDLRDELAEVTRQRDELAAALDSLKSDFRKWALEEDRLAAVEYLDEFDPAKYAKSLEEICRKAKIEALEGLPCDNYAGKRSCVDIFQMAGNMCPRCKALAELKGGRG